MTTQDQTEQSVKTAAVVLVAAKLLDLGELMDVLNAHEKGLDPRMLTCYSKAKVFYTGGPNETLVIHDVTVRELYNDLGHRLGI